MNSFRHLQRHAEELSRCSACGACQTTCPLFELERDSKHSPRGYMGLIIAWQEGKISDGELASALDACLMCGRCAEACPIHLPLTEIFTAARADLGIREKLANSFLRQLLRSPRLLAALWRSGNKVAAFVHAGGLPGRKPTLPPPALSTKKKGGVALFTGCLALYALPELANSAASILTSLGHEWHIPAFACCGAFAAASGHTGNAIALIRHNLKILQACAPEHFIVLCPHCLEQIKKLWPTLPWLDDRERETASNYGSLAQGIASFLLAQPRLPDLAQKPDSLCWHKPCLLKDEEEKAVLRLLFQSGFRIDGHVSACCGNICAGTLHPLLQVFRSLETKDKNTARNMMARKLWQASQAKRPALTISGCPGCLLRIDRAADIGTDSPRHWLQLYADNIRRKSAMDGG